MSLKTIACNAFLHHCPPPKRSALVKYLSAVKKQALEVLSQTYRDPTQGLSSLSAQLERVHFSWFTPYLRTLSQREVKFFLSAFPGGHATELKTGLLFSEDLVSLTPPAKTYFQKLLLKYLIGEEVEWLPIECLPESPLNDLLELPLAELNTLIDFLGLHDLTVEMRHIIDTSKLKQISGALSSDEQSYVKMLMQSREPVIFPRMGLAQWQGEKEKLKLLIRGRGLNRLAKGLYGEHPSLLWHLSHKLDIDRALSLQKLYAPLENASVSKLLRSQILELRSFMRKPHE